MAHIFSFLHSTSTFKYVLVRETLTLLHVNNKGAERLFCSLSRFGNDNSRSSTRGSRKFCQRGSNSDNVCFLVDEGRGIPNTTKSGQAKRHWNDDGPTLNAGLVAL